MGEVVDSGSGEMGGGSENHRAGRLIDGRRQWWTESDGIGHTVDLDDVLVEEEVEEEVEDSVEVLVLVEEVVWEVVSGSGV